MGPFAIQYDCDWFDYPEWREYQEYVGPNEWRTLRFASRDEAQAYIDRILDEDYERQRVEYEKQKPKLDRARDLHKRRLAVLEAAGLGKQSDESFHPLIVAGVSCHEPVRKDGSAYRIVSESELDDDDD